MLLSPAAALVIALVAVLLATACGGGASTSQPTPSATAALPANPTAASSAVRRGTSAAQNLMLTGSVSGTMTSAVTQCAILKRRDPDGVSDVFQGVLMGSVGGASHSLRIVLQKFTGAGAYQSTADVVRATAIVDADAPEAANVVVNADGKSGTIEAAGSDPVSGSWSCSAVLTIG